jgi:hypothetical protein
MKQLNKKFQLENKNYLMIHLVDDIHKKYFKVYINFLLLSYTRNRELI